MGRIVIHDGEFSRSVRSDQFTGEVEVDLTGDEPAVVVPENFTVSHEDGPPDRQRLTW